VHCNLPSRIRISLIKGYEVLANMELECGEYYLGRRDTSKFLFRLYVVINLSVNYVSFMSLYIYDFFVLFFNAFIRLVHDIPSE